MPGRAGRIANTATAVGTPRGDGQVVHDLLKECPRSSRTNAESQIPFELQLVMADANGEFQLTDDLRRVSSRHAVTTRYGRARSGTHR